jgi:transcriptional regulator with XRE-family HTH domain
MRAPVILHRDIYREVGTQLRSVRLRRGLTLEQLAALSGLSAAYIGQVERSVKKPSLRTLAILAQALGVSPASLCPNHAPTEKVVKEKSLDALVACHPPKERQFITRAVEEMSRSLKKLRR